MYVSKVDSTVNVQSQKKLQNNVQNSTNPLIFDYSIGAGAGFAGLGFYAKTMSDDAAKIDGIKGNFMTKLKHFAKTQKFNTALGFPLAAIFGLSISLACMKLGVGERISNYLNS